MSGNTRRRFAVILFGCTVVPAATVAQQPQAQQVRLELRPRVGDTLMLRIEQQTELIGALLRPSRDTSVTIKTSMLMFARAVIESSTDSGAVVMAMTDSVTMNSTPEDVSNLEALERSIIGKKVYMRLLPDGSSEFIKADAAVSSVIRAILADMPATLPKGPVEVGSTWERTVNVPIDPAAPGSTVERGRPAPLSVRTTFRLDSLSATKRMAYISLRGLIAEAAGRPASDAQNRTSGDMHGKMTLDRQRGWVVHSLATITINAVVKRPVESMLPPLNFQIRITQQMRTLNAR